MEKFNNKFNFLFITYLIMSIIVFLFSFITLIFINKINLELVSSLIPFDVLLNSYFFLTLAYLGINASEKWLTPSSFFTLKPENLEDNKKKLSQNEKYTNFKRKRFIIIIWFLYTIINFILSFVYKSLNPDKDNLINLANNTYYFFVILMIFFYIEQYKEVLLTTKSPLEKNGDEKNKTLFEDNN